MKKSALAISLSTLLSTNITHATVIGMEFSGLFTMVEQDTFVPIQNTSYPYYGDPTWSYGLRSQIAGTLQYNTNTGYGTATIVPFDFISKRKIAVYNLELQSIGNGLILGNINSYWGPDDFTSQIVLDGSGLFTEINTGVAVGDVYDATSCAVSTNCATPASNGYFKNFIPIGPVPIATTSFNTIGQNGINTVLTDLSLGTDDGNAGSPMDNGPFTGSNISLDITSIEVTTVPVPASIWLFGTGLLAIFSAVRRRNRN